MEEGSWERFMSTGRIEDYLKFKSCFTEGTILNSKGSQSMVSKEEKKRNSSAHDQSLY